MVAGGGASVIFADTIVEKGGVSELANYGEYSGAPNEGQVRKFLLYIFIPKIFFYQQINEDLRIKNY